LHRNHPNRYATAVRTSCEQVWENNRYIVPVDQLMAHKEEVRIEGDDPTQVQVPAVKLEYPLIHKSNQGPYHFTEGYTDYIEQILDVRIRDRLMRGHIEISEQEKSWISQVHEITGEDNNFWIVVNGGKTDFTAKWWDPIRMQRVVDAIPELLFVQVGDASHYHVPLRGNNVINLVGRTDIRQLIRLVYHSSGVVCPVTSLMHLAAAVPVRPEKTYGRHTRPCVVIAGGREPAAWEAYTGHIYLHTCGLLPCCDSGGCWKSRVVPLNDGDEKDKSLCERPTKTENGITIPQCLKMITVQDVVRAIRLCLP